MKNTKTILTNFKEIDSEKINQSELIKYIKGKTKEIEKTEKYSIPESIINKRNFFAYLNEEGKLKRKKTEFTKNNSFDTDTESRIKLGDKLSLEILTELYKNEANKPDEIIYSTSIEGSMPSPAQILTAKKEWNNTFVSHSEYFGCLGAFPSLRAADNSIQNLRENKKQVDVVNLELVSMYFDSILNRIKKTKDPLEIIKGTLFGDGAIKYSATSKNAFMKTKQSGLEIITTHIMQIPKTQNEVYWRPDEKDFHLYISKDLPTYVKNNILSFTKELCKKENIDFEKEKNNLLYAIHPGGPKIIYEIEDEFKINKDLTRHTKNFLYENGNASSASCPIIWKSILEDVSVKENQKIITFAIGPGITIEGAILKKITC